MNQNIRATLVAMAGLSMAYQLHAGPRPAVGSDVSLNQFLVQMRDQATPENLRKGGEEYLEAVKAAKMGDDKQLRQILELRKTVINNYISVQSTISKLFFEEVNLGGADQAYFVNETMQPVNVGVSAEDGKTRLVKAIAPQANTVVPLYAVKSDRVTYKLKDGNRGPIADAARRTFDIAADAANALDKRAFDLMTADIANGGVFGSFVVSGAKHLRTYNAGPRILTANLPTTNKIVLSDNTATVTDATAKFRIAVLKAVIKYCDGWANTFPVPLRPTGLIIVPSIDATDLLDTPDLVSPKQNQVIEGLLSNYTRIHFGGVDWTIVPDATLPAGIAYAVLSKPVGHEYRKRSMDMDHTDTRPMDNEETRMYEAWQGLATPVPWRVNAVSVQYRTLA